MNRISTFAASIFLVCLTMALAGSTSSYAAGKKVLIVLQENSGQIPFETSLPSPVKSLISAMIDGVAETFEDLKTTLQGAGRYDRVHLLTDNNCKRASLLTKLVDEKRDANTVDLVVLGHGTTDQLLLKGESLTGGASGNIRSLRTDAISRGVSDLNNLRMVFMVNCKASTLNDDWTAIGAKASIGSSGNDYMPEPMTTFFVYNWLGGQKTSLAASNAYEATKPFYLPIFPPVMKAKYKNVTVQYWCGPFPTPWTQTCTKTIRRFDGYTFEDHDFVKQTRLVVGGNGNLTF